MADDDLVCYPNDDQALKSALELVQTEAMEFARRLGKDSQVRKWYMEETKKFAEALMEDVRQRRITPSEAAHFREPDAERDHGSGTHEVQ